MTNQQAYNKVKKHLLKQGRPAMDAKGCRYRGPDGTKCAIGCLIPDSQYRRSMEFVAVGEASSEVHPKALKGLDFDMLYELQELHDNPKIVLPSSGKFNLPELKRRLAEVAQARGLKP